MMRLPFIRSIRNGWKYEDKLDHRTVMINMPQLQQYEANVIITSKYTIFNFLFKNLFEQFQKATNCYFLCVAILQAIPQVSATGGTPTILFPLFLVLFANGCKDAYEDYKRHKCDDFENKQVAYVLPKNCSLVREIFDLNKRNLEEGIENSDDESEERIGVNEMNGNLETSFPGTIDEFVDDHLFYNEREEEEKPRVIDMLDRAGFKKVCWRDLRVGDLVLSRNHDAFPADLALLATSDRNGTVFVETANLDGETNLKVRNALQELDVFQDMSEVEVFEEISRIEGLMVCDLPNKNLNSFDSSLELHLIRGEKTEKQISVSNKQLLLRGCKQRNTDWTIGVVVYAGQDTKIQQNSTEAPHKVSRVEKRTNSMTIIICIIQFALCVVAATRSVLFIHSEGYASRSYNGYAVTRISTSVDGILSFFTWVTLTTNMIPISLVVTMGIVKVIQGYWICVDPEMYDDDTDQYASARTSDLNEELGQVEYIFSDKTGTLTCNSMVFKKCFVKGMHYGQHVGTRSRMNGFTSRSCSKEHLASQYLWRKREENVMSVSLSEDPLMRSHLSTSFVNQSDTLEFMLHLAMNHSAIPEVDEKGVVTYSASSPDEGAFVEAAKSCGVEFKGRTPTTLDVIVFGKLLKVDILANFEFTSDRKRSSIVCRVPSQNGSSKLMLYCKGADTAIFARTGGNTADTEAAMTALQSYAEEGLRTLCIAKRELTEEEFSNWLTQFHEAATSLENRDEKINECAELLEQNLEIMGITGVEDRLQDGVTDTIKTCKEAGIQVWMLTGDKAETAINIGKSSGLLDNNSTHIKLLGGTRMSEELIAELTDVEEQIRNELEENVKVRRSIITDGESLEILLKEKSSIETFLFVCSNCESVVCCRVTPYQKGAIVSSMKKMLKKVTLAIGDGANDCNMIQQADVGVGLRGKEGLQAFNSADYGLSKFRFLKPLLFVHGRLSYKRITKLVFYMFYKNIVLVFPLFFFGFYSQSSAQKIYFEYMYQLFNVLFTSLPAGVIGVLEMDLDRTLCLKYPQLYKLNVSNYFFSFKQFAGWMLTGVLQGLIVLVLPIHSLAMLNIPSSNGEPFDIWMVGTVVFLALVVVVNLKAAMESDHIMWVLLLALLLSLLAPFFVLLACAHIPGLGNTIFGVVERLYTSAQFYLVMLLTVSAAVAIDWTHKSLQLELFPNATQYVQLKEYVGKNIFHKAVYNRKMKAARIESRNNTIERDRFATGFAFSEADPEAIHKARTGIFEMMQDIQIYKKP